MMDEFEHYSLKIDESDKYIWYASTKGYIYKILKSSLEGEKRFIVKNTIMVYGYLKSGYRTIKVRNKENRMSQLLARTFLKDWYPGCCVGYKDNDPTNLDIRNLYIYSMRTHGKKTGYKSKSMPVIVTRKNPKETIKYRSVREAAKALYVSYQTLSDYLNGTVKNSVIDKLKVGVQYEQ